LNNLIETKINSLQNRLGPKDFLQKETYQDRKERLSLIKINRIYKNYSLFKTPIVDPYSDGWDSEEDEKKKEPSIEEVAAQIVDFNTFMTVPSIEDFPPEASPTLLLTNLDEWITPTYLKRFIEETPVFK
jgi:hypothetical protein